MMGFFTPESLSGRVLQYRPVVGVKEELVVSGYAETMRSLLPEKLDSKAQADAAEHVHYRAPKKPKTAIEPFFFLSSYMARPKHR